MDTRVLGGLVRDMGVVGDRQAECDFDHRGLVGCGERLFTVGGMIDAAVTDAVWALERPSGGP